MASGFKTYSASVQVDFDDIFKPIGDGTPRSDVGYKVGSTDIANRYKAVTTEASKIPFNTYFKSGSTDLKQLFMDINFLETVYYLLTVYSGSGGGSKESGSYAPITSSTAPTHYHFLEWIGSGITDIYSEKTTVLMDSDKIVSASYDLNQYTLTVYGGTGGGTQDYGYVYTIVANSPSANQHFTNWTSGQSPKFENGTSDTDSTADVSISQNTNITANYAWDQYYLTVTYGTGDGTYNYNASMAISADAAPSYQHFSVWINPVGSLSFDNAYASSTNAHFSAAGNATAEATYAWNDYTITISGDSGISYTTPSIGSDTYQYPDFPVSVTAYPKWDYDFGHWTLDGNNVGSSNPYSITGVGNHTISATTSLKNVAFTLSYNSGQGSPSANYSQYPSVVPIHTTVSVTPNPNSGYYFDYLSSDNSGQVSGTNVQLEGTGLTTITVYYGQYTLPTYASFSPSSGGTYNDGDSLSITHTGNDGNGAITAREWYYWNGSTYTSSGQTGTSYSLGTGPYPGTPDDMGGGVYRYYYTIKLTNGAGSTDPQNDGSFGWYMDIQT